MKPTILHLIVLSIYIVSNNSMSVELDDLSIDIDFDPVTRLPVSIKKNIFKQRIRR